MERTRDEVVRILHEQGTCSVAELAEAIGVSAGSARRHLDLMIGEGLVNVRLERQRRGRPVARYTLSEAGEERSAAVHYARLLDRIYPALNGLSEAAVSGQDGSTVLARIFDGIAEEIARTYAPRVHSEALGTRVVEVADALRGEGILTDVVNEEGQYRLRNVGCPYRSTAEGNHAACAADRRTIELLLGAPVQQLATIVEGAPCCEYIVPKDSVSKAPEAARASELQFIEQGERAVQGRPVPAVSV